MNLLISASAFTSETRRLFIRPLGVEDRDIYCFLYTDAEMMRFIGQPLPLERAQRSFLKAVELSSRRPLTRLFLTIVRKATGGAVGVCSVPAIDVECDAAELGLMLKVDARDGLLAKEALTALTDLVFAELQPKKVWAEIPEGHAAAAGLLRRTKFSLEARKAGPEPGSPCKLIWSMTRAQWTGSHTGVVGR